MRKILCFILALVLCLALCACGNQENPYEKYAELFNMLENENYDSAMLYIENLKGNNGDGDSDSDTANDGDEQLETVEITLDNWQEYFELREYTKWYVNAFGEYDGCSNYYLIMNKDDNEPFDGSIAVEFTYYTDKMPYTVDVEAGTVEYGESVERLHYYEPRVESFVAVGQYVDEEIGMRFGKYIMSYDFGGTEGEVERITEVDVTRIEGSYTFARR